MWFFFIKRKSGSNNSALQNKKTMPDYKQQLVIRQGTEQFKELAKKGLGIKIALL